ISSHHAWSSRPRLIHAMIGRPYLQTDIRSPRRTTSSEHGDQADAQTILARLYLHRTARNHYPASRHALSTLTAWETAPALGKNKVDFDELISVANQQWIIGHACPSAQWNYPFVCIVKTSAASLAASRRRGPSRTSVRLSKSVTAPGRSNSTPRSTTPIMMNERCVAT